MTIKEAIYQRHTVRRFKPEPIPAELVEKLNERIEKINAENSLALKLVTGNSDGIMGYAKILTASGVNNYLILAGADCKELDEKLGYFGADLCLYAQTLGLNTWWIGGMVNKKGVDRNLNNDSVRVNGVIGIGYGVTQGSLHRMKTAEKISRYEGESPQWFKDGIDALLHAPTAINRMAYKVVGKGNKVSISYAPGPLSNVDLGIGKYHFELGAGKENFEWEGNGT